MVSTVKPRPNHYEMLGLTPTATADEIKLAFNRELLRPRPFGGLAQLGVAFETLKDPAKRRVYDASIGLTPPPEPPKAPSALHSRLQYIIAPAGSERPAFNMAAASAPQSAPALIRKPEPAPPQPRPQSFIAAPAEAARPETRSEPSPLVSSRPVPREPRVEHELPPEAPFVDDGEHSPMVSRPIGIAVGGILLAAVFVGAWAGTSVQNPETPEKPAGAATLSLPPPKPLPGIADRERAAAPVAEARAERTTRRAVAAEAVRRPMPRPIQLTPEEEQQLAGSQFVESATQQIASTDTAAVEAAAEPTSAPVVAGNMPLPNRVIARTIHRIGYSCGQVTSTTALDTPGVFKITCTSGQSYQATPVRGRYHFRRMGSR